MCCCWSPDDPAAESGAKESRRSFILATSSVQGSGVWSVRFWQQNQLDHLRLSDALVQIFLDVQHGVQFWLPNSGEHHFTLSNSWVSSVCESETSEMKVCACRCATWKAHQRLFSGMVETTVSRHLPVRSDVN